MSAWRDAYFDHRLLEKREDADPQETDALLTNEARGQQATRESEIQRVEAFYDDAVQDALRRCEILKQQLQQLDVHKHDYETCYDRIPWPLRMLLLALARVKLTLIPTAHLAQEKPHSPSVPTPYTYSPSRYPLARHWLKTRCYELFTLFTSIQAFSKHNVDILNKADPPLSFKRDFVTGEHVVNPRSDFLKLYADSFGNGDGADAEKTLSNIVARPQSRPSWRTIAVLTVVYSWAVVFTAYGLYQGMYDLHLATPLYLADSPAQLRKKGRRPTCPTTMQVCIP